MGNRGAGFQADFSRCFSPPWFVPSFLGFPEGGKWGKFPKYSQIQIYIFCATRVFSIGYFCASRLFSIKIIFVRLSENNTLRLPLVWPGFPCVLGVFRCVFPWLVFWRVSGWVCVWKRPLADGESRRGLSS